MRAEQHQTPFREGGVGCAMGHPLFDERYRAIDARDTRFDGQFFTAVSSTGIYCRPSCPARTPKPANVTFYLTSASAHKAGFRACKRCLPEAAPGTPDWNLRGDLVGRAMRLIADGTVDREGVDGLASRLGYTTRHVHRILVSELGAGPLALARARRAQTARTLLVGSDIPVSQVAFAAGFGSVRQFNDTIREVFASRPNELRLQVRKGPSQVSKGQQIGFDRAVAPTPLVVELPVRQPFDAPGVFRFLAARAVAGVETADLGPRLRYARTLRLPAGPAAVEIIAVRDGGGSWQLQARFELTSLSDIAPAVSRVRRMLDLDSDPLAIDAALSTDPTLAPLVSRTPGIRVPGTADPHELVIRAVVGQQISVAAARTHLGRLTAMSGSPYVSSIPGLNRLFPTPEQVMAAVPEPAVGDFLDPDRPLRLPRRAISAVRTLSRALANGGLPVHVGMDADILRARLLEFQQVGPWTAAYTAMRVLGDPNIWLPGDAALVAGAKVTGILDVGSSKAASHRLLAEAAAAWAPWRSYAVMHLWQSAAQAVAVQEG